MKISKSKNQEHTVIIDCGRLGANMADALAEANGNVLVIDKNEMAFRRLSASYGGLTFTGDATDIDTLIEAQIADANVIIIVTNNDNTNILIAQLVRELSQARCIIARLYDPERKCVYQELGIATICPVMLSRLEIDKIMQHTSWSKSVS